MLPHRAQNYLDNISRRLIRKRTAGYVKFQSQVCGNEWDVFIEQMADKCYKFLQECLGPFQKEPLPIILPMGDGFHMSGANASFSPSTGQIELCARYIYNKPGTTLEKVCHELLHANLNDFPEGDPFYEEGYIDYSIWVIAHSPWWEPHRDDMIKAAAHNIHVRKEKAIHDLSDYDRKRWAGGIYCSLTHGPWILSKLRAAKTEDLQW
jgi:hypothetical protein